MECVWKYLSVKDLLTFCSTSKENRRIVNSSETWRYLLFRDYHFTYTGNDPKKTYKRYYQGRLNYNDKIFAAPKILSSVELAYNNKLLSRDEILYLIAIIEGKYYNPYKWNLKSDSRIEDDLNVWLSSLCYRLNPHSHNIEKIITIEILFSKKGVKKVITSPKDLFSASIEELVTYLSKKSYKS